MKGSSVFSSRTCPHYKTIATKGSFGDNGGCCIVLSLTLSLAAIVSAQHGSTYHRTSLRPTDIRARH